MLVSFYGYYLHFAPVAQSVEQLPFKERVPGSNPGGRKCSEAEFPPTGSKLLCSRLDEKGFTMRASAVKPRLLSRQTKGIQIN